MIPQRVRGPNLTVQTHFATVDIMPFVFLRVRSGVDAWFCDFTGAQFWGTP